MFVRQHQNQFRTANADVQMFYAPFTTAAQPKLSWNKPPGVSHVYIMLIGAGGGVDGTGNGGGSGAVTVWYGAAQHVPDILFVKVDFGNNADRTAVLGKFSGSAFTELLRANSATAAGPTAGTATASTTTPLAAMGFYQSVAGQDGTIDTASATTFLSGGNPSLGGTKASNYGYTVNTAVNSTNGMFQLQPIIVGMGSKGNTGGALVRAPIGCGAGGTSGTTNGGNGFALIASW